PLAIACLAGIAHTAPMYVGKIHREARIPDPPAFGLLAGQIGGVLDSCAETGRADHRAVAAGHAARGDIFPVRVIVAFVESLLEAGHFEAAAHVMRYL